MEQSVKTVFHSFVARSTSVIRARRKGREATTDDESNPQKTLDVPAGV